MQGNFSSMGVRGVRTRRGVTMASINAPPGGFYSLRTFPGADVASATFGTDIGPRSVTSSLECDSFSTIAIAFAALA